MRSLRALAVVSVFGLLLWRAVADQRLPAILLWLVGLASLLSLILYAVDKRAAIAGDRRIPEATLHLVELAGGWPGALLAQSLLRHKTIKREFRQWFWCAVLLNCAALGWLAQR
ncbi:MAG: DUF1294 domain-containing protein [Herminiimonas sp.]|nr:DUF1294 domain-containing protein [Herminiimonas sp.]